MGRVPWNEPGIVMKTLNAGAYGIICPMVNTAEPPQPDHPLLGFDQVVLTPHIADLTAESAERMAVASVQKVLDYFAGRLDSALIVNSDALA